MAPGELIRQHRLQAGLTQHQLAVRAGTTKTAVSRLEGGHLDPGIQTLQRLLLCMGYDLQVDTIPLTPRIDPSQLDAVAGLTPTQRLDHALGSQSSLTDLVGAARGR